MWLCLSDAFLSIVAIPETHGLLKVRARRLGDIDRLFPGAVVSTTPGRDYLYRAELPRAEVARVLSSLVQEIDYPNFKDSVGEPKLRKACGDVWSRMAKLQPIPPYQTR